jgi:hypothetical protein
MALNLMVGKKIPDKVNLKADFPRNKIFRTSVFSLK